MEGQSSHHKERQALNTRKLAVSVNEWLQCIRDWYPELHSRTYFVPPLHFNRIAYNMELLAEQCVLVPKTAEDDVNRTLSSIPTVSSSSCQSTKSSLPKLTNVMNSDVRVDRAHERELLCLRALTTRLQDAMMVVSRLQFGKYLDKESYSSQAASFRRPRDLKKEHRRGEFDLLIIHRQFGFFTANVKTVGDNLSKLGKTEDEVNVAVVKKVQEAVNQLNRAEIVLGQLIKDLSFIPITKVLITPNLRRSQLMRAVQSNPFLTRDLCHCLRVRHLMDATALCLCDDYLSDNKTPWDVTEEVFCHLRDWWYRVTSTHAQTTSHMTQQVYEDLIARFCGPATTIEIHGIFSSRLEVRTEGDGVSETGERMTQFVLSAKHFDLLNMSPPPPRVFLTGPPGTGKTTLLILRGLKWLQDGHDVRVLSTSRDSRAASHVIQHTLQKNAAASSVSRSGLGVQRYHFDFDNKTDMVNAVSSLTGSWEKVCILADEICSYNFKGFCDRLLNQVPDACLWSASVLHDIGSHLLQQIKLGAPLRSPPVVVREVMKAEEIQQWGQVYRYTENDVPVSTDGPAVKRIYHYYGQSGHSQNRPYTCRKCGHQIAQILQELNIGKTGSSTGPPALHFRDVFVLCEFPPLTVSDASGHVNREALGLDRGLRECHVPVRVVRMSDDDEIRDTALADSDQVTMARWNDVRGLERKVVVVVKDDWPESDVFDRLHSASRCTAQLVWVVSHTYDFVESTPDYPDT